MKHSRKILLYEPEKEGHREIYIHYISSALHAAGWKCEHISEPYHTKLGRLTNEARARGALWIFICTFDGKFPRIAGEAIYAHLRGIKVSGIYFLYNNVFSGWKGLVWQCLLATGVVDRLFVMDPFFKPSDGAATRRISAIPDTYERSTFPKLNDRNCRERLDLALESCVFLAFGALDSRKGIDVLAAAAASWEWERFPNVQFVFAGKASEEVSPVLAELQRAANRQRKAVVVIPKHIPEMEISLYYGAASYLVAPYPKWFAVSSGAITRAFAAGVPVVTGAHGVNGRVVRELGAGIIYNSGSVTRLRSALEAAAHIYTEQRSRWLSMRQAAAAEGERRELDHFFKAIQTGLPAPALDY